jgi:hypothetical protein
MLGDRFARGRSKFTDHRPEVFEPTAKIYVKVRLADRPEVQLAQLDTGAAWSVLSTDLAKAVGVVEGDGERITLSSRFGAHQGYLVRLAITFLAEEGEALETDGTFFVSSDWPSPVTFLGYSGLLDSIRFALDPQANHFYFGSS